MELEQLLTKIQTTFASLMLPRTRIMPHHSYQTTVFLITLLALVPSCSKVSEQRDAWQNHPPDHLLRETGYKLDPKSEVFEVPQSTKLEAERLLENVPFVELTPEQTKRFSNGVSATKGKTSYLVRGLYYVRTPDGFQVFQDEKSLWVDHGCLSHIDPPISRQPLVVLLKKKPETVFVSASIAE
jgi:hypothetical protein